MIWVPKLTKAGWAIGSQLATHLQAEAEADDLAGEPQKAKCAVESAQTTVPGQLRNKCNYPSKAQRQLFKAHSASNTHS